MNQLTQSEPALVSAVVAENGEKTTPDRTPKATKVKKAPENDHLLVLKKPLLIDERTIKQLSLDCSKLTGADFRELATEYRLRTNNPNVMNLIYDEAFRLTVIARINEIPYEDLDALSFADSVKATSRVIYFFVE
jgi:Phage tail assembly chaperone proteins, E, or 41 or 14